MKTLLCYFLYFCIRFALFLRYRIEIKGVDAALQHRFDKSGGICFLANHPAEIDPCILITLLWPKFRPHPVAIEFLFYNGPIRFFLDLIGAIPVPDFDKGLNSYKQKKIEETYEKLITCIKQKENLLIYPAGGLKVHADEKIGGTSGVHKILEICPDANVVLIRTTGLWGSSFSRALTGKSPAIVATFLNGVKIVFKNLIFFCPRRKVLIEMEAAPSDFPYGTTRLKLNRYLENWFNAHGKEPLYLVSYSMWRYDVPSIPPEVLQEKKEYGEIPKDIAQKVKEEIAELAKVKPEEVKEELELAADLGLDSLDQAQLSLMLKQQFGIDKVHPTDLTTVASVMAFAAGYIESEQDGEEEVKAFPRWEKKETRPLPYMPPGKTISEVFLKTCDARKDLLACVDALSGDVSYHQMKRAALAVSQVIKTLPGDRIGILLPASIAVNVTILATLFAGKIPVMINWTLGARHLKTVVQQSGIHRTISSWRFINQLENVDFNGLDDQLVFLEEIKRNLTFKQKIQAGWMARKKALPLLKCLGLDKQKEDQTAVILFTSGTENVPKGVPLSHKNILINQNDAVASAAVTTQDVMLGSLPPFHSFGFSVTGLLPLLAGMRVAFCPNPVDGKQVASSIEKWAVTIICLAPTFVKNLVRAATMEQFASVRLLVVGAEKMPDELSEKVKSLNPNTLLVEGYGITECAPILTLNPILGKSKGVGKPFPHVTLKIVHPETLTPLPLGKEGLILAKGENIFAGYLDKNLSSPFVEIEGEKWYQTGDLGSLDQEGYLTLSGRLKRFVKIGGEMISLNAIEEVLTEEGKKQGWKLLPEQPSLAICSTEEGGKKGEIHLFTVFPLSVEMANGALKGAGMSNLIKLTSITQIPFIPLLGTGKIDYQTLKSKLKTDN